MEKRGKRVGTLKSNLCWFGLMLRTLLVGSLPGAAQILDHEQEQAIAQAPLGLKTKIIKQVATHAKTSLSEWTFVSFQREEYPFQGRVAYLCKLMGKHTHNIQGILVDANGRELDENRVEVDEQVAYFTRFGRLDLRLADQIAFAREDQSVEVVLWLKTPPYTPPDPPGHDHLTQAQREAFQKEAFEKRATFIEKVVTPVRERLAAWNIPSRADTLSPVIYVTLGVTLIYIQRK